jgi:hypothetical protein
LLEKSKQRSASNKTRSVIQIIEGKFLFPLFVWIQTCL